MGAMKKWPTEDRTKARTKRKHRVQRSPGASRKNRIKGGKKVYMVRSRCFGQWEPIEGRPRKPSDAGLIIEFRFNIFEYATRRPINSSSNETGGGSSTVESSTIFELTRGQF